MTRAKVDKREIDEFAELASRLKPEQKKTIIAVMKGIMLESERVKHESKK